MTMTVVLSGIYTVLVIAIGFWAGHSFTQTVASKSKGEQDELHLYKRLEQRLRQELKAQLAGSQQVLKQTQDLRAMAVVQQPAVPAPMMQAIEQLAGAADTLSARLASLADHASMHAVARAVPERSRPTPQTAKRTVAKPEAHVAVSMRPAPADIELTCEEVRDLSESVSDFEFESAEESARHRFVCEQYVARWYPGQAVPHPSQFDLVKCRDISVQGISFFVKDRPDFDYFIIAMGSSEHSIVMSGKVLDSRVVFMYGEVGYLARCQFMNRIKNLPPGWELQPSERQAC